MATPIAFLRECFAFADAHGRGVLNLQELKCAVAAALGIRTSKLVLAQMFDVVLLANGETIEEIQVTQQSFVSMLLPRVQKTDLLEQLRRCFKAFDLRSQGFISFASFEAACISVVPHMSQKSMCEIFREADRDGDGRVTYNDFETIYLIGEQVCRQLPPLQTPTAPHCPDRAVKTKTTKARALHQRNWPYNCK